MSRTLAGVISVSVGVTHFAVADQMELCTGRVPWHAAGGGAVAAVSLPVLAVLRVMPHNIFGHLARITGSVCDTSPLAKHLDMVDKIWECLLG